MNHIEEIEAWFTYHPATSEQAPRYAAVRDAAKLLAFAIKASTPVCADQAASLRKLRECVHMANAAIALEGK